MVQEERVPRRINSENARLMQTCKVQVLTDVMGIDLRELYMPRSRAIRYLPVRYVECCAGAPD
jgi:hypothetical protein